MFSSDPFWGSSGATIIDTPTDAANTDVSTLDTLRIMSAIARRDSQSPIIKSLAASLCESCNSQQQCAQAIWYFVHGFLTFRPHEDLATNVVGVPQDGIDRQVLISPASLLALPSPEGDCAIYSSLTAALLLAQGIKASYRTTASDKDEPWRWSHVYVIAHLHPNDLTLDTSHGDYPGWETRVKFRQYDYAI